MTTKQIANRTGIPTETCCNIVAKLADKSLIICLNTSARNSRLYWLTEQGKVCQAKLRKELGLPATDYDLPNIDWSLYGWVCYSHRTAVIKSLNYPMQPAELKRFMRIHKPAIKISANNIRDVMRLFLKKGLVRKVFFRKKAHPRYELTELASQFRTLLMRTKTTSS